jgi:formylglycine-generating enzyme required for sulfatase activity
VLALLASVSLLLAALPGKPPESPSAARVRIPAGTFRMGTDDGLPYEGPAHVVSVSAFELDRYEVTNARFAAFVARSGYVTEAERLGWSGVFVPAQHAWQVVPGASWKHPQGPRSSLTGRARQPVVHVSYADALAYCTAAGGRLPTEAEWEWAARGGLRDKRYPWGDSFSPGGRLMANTWQGLFPQRDLGTDGQRGVGPVGRFPPNGYGLYDMAGNVWEWTADWFAADYYARSAGARDPRGPATGRERVTRGGSWMCADNYCRGYRVAARQHTAPDSGLDNLGLRCAR